MRLRDLQSRASGAGNQGHIGRWIWFALLFAEFLSPGLLGGEPAIWYPPVPPALGAPVLARDAAASTAPAALAYYINESFYAPLSIRLAADVPDKKLDDALRARLESYRATKAALQTELLAKIYLLRETDAAARLSGFEEFSLEQTPRVTALEGAAEALRRDLITSGFSEQPRQGNEATVLRAAAFFEDGLSPDQRRLLGEMAAEIDAAAVSGSDGAWFFFSPAGSRIRPLVNQSAQCAVTVRTYEGEKNSLKRELRAAVTKLASASALAELAAKQAPRFARLEVLAEEIRRGLAIRNDPTRRPELPPLPPELDARIAAYRREKLDLQKALLAKVDEVSKKQPTANRRPPSVDGSTLQQQERIREAIAAYTRDNAARYAALDKNRDAIRRDLAHLANSGGASAGAPSADELLRKFSEAMQQIEVWRNYRDYQIAVLQPGLSPEQRRLLFGAALETLALARVDGAVSP